MASPVASPQSCTIALRLFDGTRRPLPQDLQVLVTLRDGNQKTVYREFSRGPSLVFAGLPFWNNFVDSYTVVASAGGYEQAGYTPVKVSPTAPQHVALMLLKKDAGYNFSGATWDQIEAMRPTLARLLAAGAADPRTRYHELIEGKAAVTACLLNLTTVMAQTHLPEGTALDYLRELIWDETMEQDRFFGWTDRALVEQVRIAAQQGAFEPEPGAAIFHPGATCSFKQVQFGEANLQLSFHEDDRRLIDGVECVKVEPDIDYYRDPLAHALLEVAVHRVTGSVTDPRQVYVLRWMAGRRAALPEFDPLYTIT
jgi:hypothetical protein